jgi:hypothetical protein
MRTAIFDRRRTRAVGVGAAGALALSLVAASASATVVSGDDPVALANAMLGTATSTGATLAVDYPCVADDAATATDEGVCPTGVGSTPVAGFPTNGSTYAIISSGNAALADDPNDSGGSGEDWGVPATPIGPDVYDYQVVRIDLGPASGNCLAFDFKFLSEEYPEYVNSGFNDAFIAQLNTWAVTADPASQTVIAPGNFAAGAGDVISVDGAGPSAMTEAMAAGSTYDGSTLPLIARTPVTPGGTNSLYLTIFDQGDGILDSTAFVDNVRYETQPPGQCKSLAVDPFEGVTGVVVTPGTTGSFSPNLATFTVPLTSKLPTGPIATNLTATATFLNWGDVVPRRSARMAKKVTTALGSGSATIPAGGSGNLVLTTTPAGVAAVQAAKAQPAALLAQAKAAQELAKKFTKKAKKLKKKAKTASPAKAKKLKKKAKKLNKKAKALRKSAAALTAQSKALAAQPLGTVVVTVTNPSNAKSELLRFQIPR